MVISEVASFIPNPFGGFAPFPNSIMIPFMATQSAVLGYNFGIGYEIGKRTIKSLDNDFFNKIRAGSTDTISVVTDGKEIKMQYNEYISFITKRHGHEQIAIFESMVPNFLKLQDTIIEKSVEIEMKKAQRTPSAFLEILQQFGQASAKLLVEKVDLMAETEKTFILTTQPFIATIYFLHKLLGGIKEEPFDPRFDPTKEPPPAPGESTPIDPKIEPPEVPDFPPPPTPPAPDDEPTKSLRDMSVQQMVDQYLQKGNAIPNIPTGSDVKHIKFIVSNGGEWNKTMDLYSHKKAIAHFTKNLLNSTRLADKEKWIHNIFWYRKTIKEVYGIWV